MRRWVRVLLIVILVPLALGIFAILFITQTDWGRERVRRFAVSTIQDMIDGEVRIGAVEGNLLRGVRLIDVSIVDADGRPFLAADAISAQIGGRALLRERIDLRNVRLERPVIVLDRRPGDDRWNFQRIFPTDPDDIDVTREPGWGAWVQLSNVRIDSGRVMIRTPWEPDNYLTEAARQQAIDAALAGEGRNRVVQVPGGLQQVMDFRALSAVLPTVRIAQPDQDAMLIEVASLESLAEPFLPPAANIRDLRGTFRVAEDSLWFRGVELEMPRSAVVGSGTYYTDDGDLLLRLSGERVALNDLRWLYPRLPSDGGGPLDLTLAMRGEVMDVHAETRGIRIQDARIAGRLGLVMGNDTLRLRGANLRFENLDTRLIEQLVPDLDIPRRGRLAGRISLDGPTSAMRVDGDVTFDDALAGRNRVLASGEAGMVNGTFRARELRLRFDPVQVALAREAMPDLPVGGTVTGTATISGSTATRMTATVDLVHRDAGEMSAIAGRGGIEFVGAQRIELDIRAQPLSLATAGRFLPAIDLQGNAIGTIRLSGNMDDAALAVDLRLPGRGLLEGRGRLSLAGAEPGYDFTTALQVVDVSRMVVGAPPSSITATITGRGVGLDPETMNAAFAFTAADSDVDGVVFEEAHGRLSLRDGLLELDTLLVTTSFARVHVGGSFGLRPDREGELQYEVAVDSLGALSRWLPPADTGQVEPAPRPRARAAERARREWARMMEAAEVERVAAGAAERRPVTPPATEETLARDTIMGAILLRGTASGSTDRFDVRGDATMFDVVAYGNALGFGRMEYAIADAPDLRARVVVGATLDSLRAAGFAFDTVHVRAVLEDRVGELQLAIIQETDIEYVTEADFVLRPEQNSIVLSDLRMRFDTTVWASVRPAAIRWGPDGIQVDSVDLRSGTNGRIWVNGTLPTEDDLDLEIDIHRLELAHVVALIQREETSRGVLTLTARAAGSPSSPRIRGGAGLVAGRVMNREIPDVRASFSYADQMLVANAEALDRDRAPLLVADARIPLDLALVDADGPRVLDRPMEIDVVADGMPLDALPSFTDAVANVRGSLTGELSVRGTVESPEVNGDMNVALGSFMIVASGMQLHDLTGTIRIRGDTLVIDSLVGWARGPVRLEGGLGLATLAEPSFDLRLMAENARIYNTSAARVQADLDLRMTGPWDGALITGEVVIRSGEYNLDEGGEGEVIDLRDPQLLREIDPALLAEESDALPDPFPLLDNLRAELSVRVSRDMWVRSTEANVEIYSVGDLELELDMARDLLTVEGVVNTDRGEYTFLGRRFLISRGSVTFIGGEQINPLLQIVAEHEVRGRDPFEIQVVIGGTLAEPEITLESNAQPPISQTELLTYIAFGRQAGSLLQLQGSSGLTEGGRLTGGRVIGLATQQMAAVALGVLVSEVERTAGRTLGAEVIHISPGDVPEELARGAPFREILRGTEVEVGRYIDTRTFVAVQSRLYGGNPGIRVQYRLPSGYRIETSLEPRFEVRPPTLSDPPDARALNMFGLFLIREWRF
jgi:translocation and assembly module TamB